MEDENGVSKDGGYETAIAVKLMAGWSLTGDDCEVCVTQLVCNRLKQIYCVSCLEWKKTTEVSEEFKAPKCLRVIKSLPGPGKMFKQQPVAKEPLDSPRPRTTLQQHLFCSVPPVVIDDDESGPIKAALWEERRTDDASPRTVLDGPESSTSGWSDFSSKKNLLPFDESVQPSQKHCMQSLWRSFASKKWQSFPSSYKKKELSISDPVLLASPRSQNGASELHEESVDDLLSAKRSWQTFSYEELSLATNNFDPENLVGKGGYAKVFKGVLNTGQLIAVKKHSRGDTAAEKERDFLIELGIVSHVSHTNVAKLLGICIENGLHLVFQFSTLGSLQLLLHSSPSSPVLMWEARMKVAVGVARGMHYLHEKCQRRIIHRDIKASNILLDSDYEPQISDFGLSKWLPDRWTHHTVSPIEGTFGYLAPEYFMHGIVDEKTDVFSYGVLLLELITGRRPINSEKQNLVIWAKPHLSAGNIKGMVDPRLDGAYDADQMQRMVLTAGLCVRRSAPWRPSMSQVVQLLSENAVEKKSEHVARLLSKSHDFAFSDTESQEDYGYTDDYESDMQRHRALALEFE